MRYPITVAPACIGAGSGSTAAAICWSTVGSCAGAGVCACIAREVHSVHAMITATVFTTPLPFIVTALSVE